MLFHCFLKWTKCFLICFLGSNLLAQNLLATAQEEGGGEAAGVGNEGGGEEEEDAKRRGRLGPGPGWCPTGDLKVSYRCPTDVP